MSTLVCFQVGAFGVNFSAAVEVAPMYPPPAIWGGVAAPLVPGFPEVPLRAFPGEGSSPGPQPHS